MKKKPLDKKKRKQVRDRHWETEAQHAFSFTHDLAKHRRATVRLREQSGRDDPLPQDFEPNGTVISHSKKWAFVELEDGERLCLIDERLKERDCTLLAPGDQVWVEFEAEDAFVRGIAPRRTKLCRPGHEDARLKEQVFAANIDLLIVVAAAAQPPFRVGLVDRYLIAAEVGGVTPLLCVNKIDLTEREPAEIALFRDMGVQVVAASCKTGQGIGELREALRGRTSILSGHSGVGKSSLLNRMDPNLAVHTQEVSDSTSKGRHTTTASRLYTLSGGIRIIDTPGLRALGLWGVEPPELAFYFPELAARAPDCRFRNCTHTREPKCAVLEAVEAGLLSRARHASYMRIRASLESETGHTPGRLKPR